jgi:hypothetical protein
MSPHHKVNPQWPSFIESAPQKLTREELLQAMADFYKKFRDRYPDAARDFFAQHPHLGS